MALKISRFLSIGILASFLLIFLTTSEARAENNLSSQSAEIINYDLPYPGMLPDNPLYKLKVLRDKITTFLINDPLKKIEFLLLQADKGIRASSMLLEKNKINLAKETALKAEHNMTILMSELQHLPKKPENALFDKLKTASLKHQEILQHLANKTKGEDRKTFLTVLDFSKRNLATIDKYAKKNPMTWTDWTK